MEFGKSEETPRPEDCICIKGARVNNLKNIDVKIPRGKLVVVTGLSGSGKSSLAFDTLYAEGQRRYVESLSAYARQFLGRMNKPECDYIKGIPPAIAIKQKVTSRNPRSTVGTATEIYEYMRLLYARIGRTFSPVSGEEVKSHTTEDVVRYALSYPSGTKVMVMCRPRSNVEVLEQQGFARILVNGEVVRISEYEKKNGDDIYLIVDRLSVSDAKDVVARLTDSAETAFYEGNGELTLQFLPDNTRRIFSTRFEADGIKFEKPSDNLFSFNSPIGACPECEGFGKVMGIDEHLVVPNTSLSLYEGAVVCWRGEKMSEWKEWFIRFNSERGFPVFKPYFELSQEEKNWLWHGTPTQNAMSETKTEELGGRSVSVPSGWTPTPEERDWGLISIDAFFDFLKQGQYKIQNRVMLARYKGKTVCPVCHGARLRKEARYVRVADKDITELAEMPVTALKPWMDSLPASLSEHDNKIAHRILTEIRNRLQFLLDVGLGYLTMNRLCNSLSGGESQRINLATSLGSSLVGSLYILDEPSIGLHSRDTDRLIKVLRQLRDLGNTVVVVEHDEEIMRAADWIIDIGPEAGRQGGKIVWQGAPPQKGDFTEATACVSHTLEFLSGKEYIETSGTHRQWQNYIEIKGARANNLKGVDVRFPLNVMTCVTGVSGSGKSSLVRDILYNALKRRLDEAADPPGEFLSLEGDIGMINAIEFIDQNPIGKSTRSNPVTYVKAWDEIRKLFALQPLAKQMGFTPAYFSFNTDGGRCEECKGEGTVTVEMQFMADLVLECESCHGQRFKKDVLDVRFEGQNVNDVLNMTVNQAIDFFGGHKQHKIVSLLKPLQDVGLGYIRLGQSSSTLSGGENQRVKLAYYLGMEKSQPTIFVFDEPTTGLHFHDIRKLLTSFSSLLDRGHTIIVIEHNVEMIKCADHVIDLGPEGGEAGGNIVACGTPEEVSRCHESYTGQYLAKVFNQEPHTCAT